MTIDEAIADAEKAIEEAGEGFWEDQQANALTGMLKKLREAKEKGWDYERFERSLAEPTMWHADLLPSEIIIERED